MSRAVYQGFWIHAHRGHCNRYLLTLSDFWALVTAMLLGVYILYAGNRTWAQLRATPFPGIHLVELEDPKDDGCHTCSRRTPQSITAACPEQVELQNRRLSNFIPRNPSCSTEDDPDDVLPPLAKVINLRDIDFSPKDAIYACLGIRIYKSRVRMLRNGCTRRSVSIYLASWAILVSGVTIGLAPFIPFFVTERGEEIPVVLSRYTEAEFEGGAISHRLELGRTGWTFPSTYIRSASQALFCVNRGKKGFEPHPVV